jgi:hypothetical protein
MAARRETEWSEAHRQSRFGGGKRVAGPQRE